MNRKTLSYYFNSIIDNTEAEINFYNKLGSPRHILYTLELDQEDMDYIRNKYLLTELETKQEELDVLSSKVDKLKNDINNIKELRNG